MLNSHKTAVSGRRIFGHWIGWIVLLAAVGAVFLLTPLRSAFFAQTMLFTQKSSQTLAGAIRSASGWGIGYALFLAVFRGMILPWIPPVLTIADTMVFGTMPGILTAWAGNILAASICFGLSHLLLGKETFLVRKIGRKLIPETIRRLILSWGGVICCVFVLWFPGLGSISGYLLGMSGISWKRWLPGLAVGEFVATIAYGLYCTPYTSSLSSGVEGAMRASAVVLMLVVLGIEFARKKIKKIDKYKNAERDDFCGEKNFGGKQT